MTSSLLPVGRSRETRQDQEYLVIALQDQLVGINTKLVLELIEQPQVQAIPNPPAFVAGVLNLRGEILSVLDLEASLFGELWPERTQLKTPVGVILKVNDKAICFLVPEVVGVFPINPDCITEEFRFLPQLQNISCISGIALTPMNEPEKSEIIEIIDIENLLSNRSAEWDFFEYEKQSLSSRAIDLSKLTDEELAQIDLIAHDSFFERQERLKHLQLEDFLLIQIGGLNLGIPLPYVQQALPAKLIEKKEDNPPIVGWMNLEDIDIPVIDPRELLFTESAPPPSTAYEIFTLRSDQITLGIAVDHIHSILKAALTNPNEPQGELTEFDDLNRSLIENIVYPVLEEEIFSIPVLKVSKFIPLLLKNKTISNHISTQSKAQYKETPKKEKSEE